MHVRWSKCMCDSRAEMRLLWDYRMHRTKQNKPLILKVANKLIFNSYIIASHSNARCYYRQNFVSSKIVFILPSLVLILKCCLEFHIVILFHIAGLLKYQNAIQNFDTNTFYCCIAFHYSSRFFLFITIYFLLIKILFFLIVTCICVSHHKRIFSNSIILLH